MYISIPYSKLAQKFLPWVLQLPFLFHSFGYVEFLKFDSFCGKSSNNVVHFCDKPPEPKEHSEFVWSKRSTPVVAFESDFLSLEQTRNVVLDVASCTLIPRLWAEINFECFGRQGWGSRCCCNLTLRLHIVELESFSSCIDLLRFFLSLVGLERVEVINS